MSLSSTEPTTQRRLVAQHLRKSYGGRQVVKDVGLSVEAGQVVGLLGPNGAGKTTSFYMIVGLVRADDGEIHLDGDAIHKLPMHLRAERGLGYLPQEASIFRRPAVASDDRAVAAYLQFLEQDMVERPAKLAPLERDAESQKLFSDVDLSGWLDEDQLR